MNSFSTFITHQIFLNSAICSAGVGIDKEYLGKYMIVDDINENISERTTVFEQSFELALIKKVVLLYLITSVIGNHSER